MAGLLTPGSMNMARYLVEAMKRTELGFHERIDSHLIEARDVPAACTAADTWLREKGFEGTAISDARIVQGDLIVAEREIGLSTWSGR
jgi:hypothetical protein